MSEPETPHVIPSFQSSRFRIHGRSNKNIVWEKGNEAYPLSIRVQTTKPHFDLFLPGMNVKENVFFFRARVQKGIA